MAPKPKEKPSAASPSAARQPPSVPIEDLFTSINRHIQRSEFNQAAKVADQVLSIAPGDEDALRCKVIGLIKNENIDEAYSVMQSSPKPPADFQFYKAYCLYRQNKLDEALEVLKDREKNSETMLLECQILYRLGKMDTCVEIYQKLQKSKIDSLEINHVASLILAGRSREVQKMMDAYRIKPSSSFELAYNVACSLIEEKQYTDAEQLLLTGRRVGQETLMEDNLAEDDIEVELAPLAVQLAYVQQLLGQSKDALETYINIVSRNLSDESSLAVAVNNLVALKGGKDVSDNLRKLDKLKDQDSHIFKLSRGLDKLSSKQRETIYTNRALLLIHANKLEQAREVVGSMSGMFADSVVPLLLQAAVFVRENKPGKAEEVLVQFCEKFPTKSKLLLLARAQVAAAAGHFQIAAESLAKISDLQHCPATVATIVALKERAGDVDGASAVFDSAIKWWSNAMTEDNKFNVVLKEAAFFKLKYGKEEEAATLFENLVKAHNSIETLAGLVSTVARVDITKAETYEKQLKPLPGLKEIDVDTLEKTSGAKALELTSQVAEPQEIKKEKQKKKRKRKPRYPKGFDPAHPGPPPDPERWLPKRERSSYRPKRKDKRAAQIRGSQGAVARDKHDASISANSNSNKTEATAPKSQASTTEQSKSSSRPSKKKSRK